MSAYKRSGWIPIEEELPPAEEYVLLSLKNAPIPCIGYCEKEEGRAWFYDSNDDDISRIGLVVNAWMPLPERYDKM
jgi:hypothetical protein